MALPALGVLAGILSVLKWAWGLFAMVKKGSAPVVNTSSHAEPEVKIHDKKSRADKLRDLGV